MGGCGLSEKANDNLKRHVCAVTVSQGTLAVRSVRQTRRQDMRVCAAAVIAFSEVMAVDSGHGKWGLALYDTGRYMRLDVAAQRALNVMKQRTDANDSFSLYGLMNKGRTAMAKRLLKVAPAPCPSCGNRYQNAARTAGS
jgi:DNA mismatch repair ATPase MutS